MATVASPAGATFMNNGATQSISTGTAGTYTVTVTVNGCYSIATSTIVVNQFRL